MRRIDKTAFFRGLTIYNAALNGHAGSERNKTKIAARVAEYDAKEGGSWNYSSLFVDIQKLLKGVPVEQVRAAFLRHSGLGEATLKRKLFDFIYSTLSLSEGEALDSEYWHITVGGDIYIQFPADFSYKRNGIVNLVIVYPNSSPRLLAQQIEVALQALSIPRPMAKEEYQLHLIEFPEEKHGRRGYCHSCFLNYREKNEDFMQHLGFFAEIAIPDEPPAFLL